MRVYQFRHLGLWALMYAGGACLSTRIFPIKGDIAAAIDQVSTSFEATVESALSL